MQQTIIDETIAFVKLKLQNAEGGHDWFHIERVWKNSKLIASSEPGADLKIVELGALLHDIADSKFHYGDETVGPKVGKELTKQDKQKQSVIEQMKLDIAATGHEHPALHPEIIATSSREGEGIDELRNRLAQFVN